jgi:hypothetical protein
MKIKTLFTAIAIIGFATATMAQVPSYVPTNGLKGWYPFNNNANDLSINANNGVVNGATPTADRFGNANSAYSFNGTSNNILVANAPFTNAPFTISAWIKLNGSLLFQIPIIGLGELGAVNNRCYFSPNYGANGTPSIGLSGACDITSTSNSATLNNWIHVAVTVSSYSVSGVIFYVNGVAYTVNSTGGSLVPFPLNNNGFTIGKHTGTNGSSNYFKGDLDEIGLWNRVLTPQEITALYQGCNSLTINTQPTNQNVNTGNNAQFTIASSSASDTYIWQTNLGLGWQDLSNAGQYSGASNDTLFVNNTTLTNNNQQFRCIVSAGSCKDTSDVGILTVVNNTSINNNSNNNEFLVYPNPAKNQINVKIATNLIGSEFNITDQLGRKVLTGKLTAETSIIELGNLANGVYLFRVGEKTQQTFKVVKE